MASNQSVPAIEFPKLMPATTSEPTSSLQQAGILLVFSSTALAVGITALRLYAKGKARQFWWGECVMRPSPSMNHDANKKFMADDVLLCAATALSIAQAVSAYFTIKTSYLGIHIEDVPEHDPIVPLRWQFIIQLWYSPILGAVKASILLFMLRLTSHMARMRWSIHALNALNLGMVASILLVVIIQCGPVEFNWDKSIRGGMCINQGWFYLSTAALTIFTDLLVLSLPFWVFLGLNMARGLKIAILCVFLVGAVVPAVGTYRLVLLYQTFFEPPPPDPTYSISLTSSVIECNLAIATASAPALRGLCRCWLPQLFSSSKPSNYPYSYSISMPPEGAGRQVFLGRSRDTDTASTAGIAMETCPPNRATSEVATRAGLGKMDGKDPIETEKDDRTTLVIIELEDGGNWSRTIDYDDWAHRDGQLRSSASPV